MNTWYLLLNQNQETAGGGSLATPEMVEGDGSGYEGGGGNAGGGDKERDSLTINPFVTMVILDKDMISVTEARLCVVIVVVIVDVVGDDGGGDGGGGGGGAVMFDIALFSKRDSVALNIEKNECLPTALLPYLLFKHSSSSLYFLCGIKSVVFAK